MFQSGVPIVVMPLDCTHKALTTRKRVDAIRALGTNVALATAAWLDFFERFDEEKYGTDGGPAARPLRHRLSAEAGRCSSGRDANIEIETASELTMGMTVIDWWGVTDRPKNALVMGNLDADGLFALITERIARL